MPDHPQRALFLDFDRLPDGNYVADHPFILDGGHPQQIDIKHELDGTWSADCATPGGGWTKCDAPTARVAMAWACAGVIEEAAQMAEQGDKAALRWMRRLGDVATFMRLDKTRAKERA